MGQLRNKMKADLKIGGYSLGTQKVYLFYARKYEEYFTRSPEKMGRDEIRTFLLHLIEIQKLSRSTIKQARAALLFLYVVTLNRPMEVRGLPSPRRHKRLPQILSGTEADALLKAVHNPKHRMVLSVMYGAGLRIAEAVAVRPEDIDSKRMVLSVFGKGDKGRTTVLSERLLVELRDYWRQTHPEGEWLFPGSKKGTHIGAEAVRRVFHKAVASAGISKSVTPHSLRHSFATHLIDTKVDVTTVQSLLGHSRVSTTSKYTHTTVQHISRITSPLDLLGRPGGAVLG